MTERDRKKDWTTGVTTKEEKGGIPIAAGLEKKKRRRNNEYPQASEGKKSVRERKERQEPLLGKERAPSDAIGGGGKGRENAPFPAILRSV